MLASVIFSILFFFFLTQVIPSAYIHSITLRVYPEIILNVLFNVHRGVGGITGNRCSAILAADFFEKLGSELQRISSST